MKPSMSIIMGAGGPKGSSGRGSKEPEEAADPKTAAAEDLIAALKAGDADAVVLAFEDLTDACSGGYADDDGEADPDEG